MNKRGKKAQGLSITTIILIVLGVIVLVVLIAGFTMGWKNIIPFIGSSNSASSTVASCQIACASGVPYDYCRYEREVSFGKERAGEIIAGVTLNEKGVGKFDCRKLEKADIGLSVCPIDCPTCKFQEGETIGTKCVACAADKCTSTKIKFGSYEDINESQVCCKVECSPSGG